MARRSSVNKNGHPVAPQPYGNISRDIRGVWMVTVPRPKTAGGFRPKPPSDDTLRERSVTARFESRSNICKTCFVAKSLKTGACNC